MEKGEKGYRRCVRKLTAAMTAVLLLVFLAGCGVKEEGIKRIKDLDFTVISEENIPEELKKVIDEKKENEFKITYKDKDFLYICVGYGEQETGGYSIVVNDLFLSDNAVYVDTNLIGPEAADREKASPSYPYIVIKIQYIDKSVVFD